jgi:response regulator RpfG family c-di-GMP phosphodiesterase
MANVLLVDDERDWLDLIRRALPEYNVQQARSYKKAIALLGGDVTYDVAIVDLNLLRPGRRDLLGGTLLEKLKSDYPSTRRIALTGFPPTAVKALLDKYDVVDLLLKKDMDFTVVRQVVEAALERTADDPPDDVKIGQAALLKSLRTWKGAELQQLGQQEQTLENDVLEAKRLGMVAKESATELTALKARRARIEKECSKFTVMVNRVFTREEMERASEEFEKLKNMLGN